MEITLIKGNPTDDELTALTMVLADLQAKATNAQDPGERNLWGSHVTPLHPRPLFNPGAFSNVTYF